MSPLLRIGQVAKSKAATYTITKEIRDTVWFAKNHLQETVVIKSVRGHRRVKNERDVLKRFQHRSPYIRPMIEEIGEPSLPVTIALRHLESDVLSEDIRRALNRREIKYVSRCVLEALHLLHEDGFVHTDVKPDNVFVNLRGGNDNRFSEVQLGDFGGCYPVDSEWATSGTFVGSPIWSSPEILFEMPWNTAADIWSYGAMVISLIYGGNFNLFRPKGMNQGHDKYLAGVFNEQYAFFGPPPEKFTEIASPATQHTLLCVGAEMQNDMRSFMRITEREMVNKDKVFVAKMMKMDWRDRPTAKELLEDEWWTGDEE